MSALKEITAVMHRQYNADLTVYDAVFLRKLLEQRRQLTGTDSLSRYASLLESIPGEAMELISSLTIEYSEFFRNPLTFALLEQNVIPGVAAKAEMSGRKEIRIWSAGCAAGQEAYSVAMLIEEYLSACGSGLTYRIFATDLLQDRLAKAKKGSYFAPALRHVPLGLADKYFTRRNDTYHVTDRVKQNIEFSVYDLLDQRSMSPPSSIYGGFDLILCCNVLIYYSRSIRRRIINKLTGALAGMGYLVTGEVEQELFADTGLVAPFFPAPLFMKEERQKADVHEEFINAKTQ